MHSMHFCLFSDVSLSLPDSLAAFFILYKPLLEVNMQRVVEKPYHKWELWEKDLIKQCEDKPALHKAAIILNLPYSTVAAMWKHFHNEQGGGLAQFDYSRIQPLRALFTKCPVCGGTTGINKNAYCHSCLSQWHPITLKPVDGLHKADGLD